MLGEDDDYADRLRERPYDIWAEITSRLTQNELSARGICSRSGRLGGYRRHRG